MNELGKSTQAQSGSGIRGLTLAASAALLVTWCACSVERNYELLSFFFDGVPNPQALPLMSSSGDPATMRQSPTYVSHSPFRDERCTECHGETFRMSAVSADVCLTCHQMEQTRYEVMHGPVSAKACLWCHVPHESAYANLLKAPARDVCAQCHEPELLNVSRTPEHADSDVSCITCHSGHGGDNQFMLIDEPFMQLGVAFRAEGQE